MMRQTLELRFANMSQWQRAFNQLHGFLRATGINDLGVSFDLSRPRLPILRLVSSAESMMLLMANDKFSMSFRGAKEKIPMALPENYESIRIKRNRAYERITEAQAPKILEQRIERALQQGYFSSDFVIEQQRKVFQQLALREDFDGPRVTYTKKEGRSYTVFLDIEPAEREHIAAYSTYGFCDSGTVPVW